MKYLFLQKPIGCFLTQSFTLMFMLRRWWGRLLPRRQSTRRAQNSSGRWVKTPPSWQNCFSFNFSDWNAVFDFSGLVWWNTRNPGDSHTMQSNWRGNPINRAMAEQQNPRPVHCLKRARSVGTCGPARCQHVWNRQLESLLQSKFLPDASVMINKR